MRLDDRLCRPQKPMHSPVSRSSSAGKVMPARLAVRSVSKNSSACSPVAAKGKELHHLRIGVDLEEEIAVALLPGAQDQALGLERRHRDELASR
jgi:hypothetical protein